MDPITALGALALVCNVTQLLEQGINLAKECREIAKTGSTKELRRIDEFNSLAAKVTSICQQPSVEASSTLTELRIKDCSVQCVAAAEKLRIVIQDIGVSEEGNTRWTHSFKKGFKSLSSRSKITELTRNFLDLQSMLQTSLLSALRDDIRQNGDTLSKQLVETNTDIRKLLEGDNRASRKALQAITDLELHLRMSIESSERNIVKRLDRLALDNLQLSNRRRLLNSLAFETMNDREKSIRSRVHDYGDTAKWIFGDCAGLEEEFTPKTPTTRVLGTECYQRIKDVHTKFESWIRTGNGIWFIEGKAGSGKSTLMNFISEKLEVAGQARALLLQWAEPKPCFVLKFFFLRYGSTVYERNFEGLWRALCFQMLFFDDELVRQATDDPAAPQTLKSALSGGYHSSNTWRTTHLRDWFLYLLSATKAAVMILLDGLDEFQEYKGGDEGHRTLLHAIKLIVDRRNHVKMLCSARPEEPFKSGLNFIDSFKLEDVNYSDIERFVQSKLDETKASPLITEITSSARGIFLWAAVVTNDLLGAAERNATMLELKQRLKHCPREMDELFQHMLVRQDKFYMKNPEPVLQFVLLACQGRFPMVFLFELLLMKCSSYSHQKLLQNVRYVFSENFKATLIEHATGFGAEVLLRCGGLVFIENSFTEDEDEDQQRGRIGHIGPAVPVSPLWRLLYSRVCFIHRTAQDFLLESSQSPLQTYQLAESEGRLSLAIATFGFMSLENSLTNKPGGGLAWWYPERVTWLIDKALLEPDLTPACCEALDVYVERFAEHLGLVEYYHGPESDAHPDYSGLMNDRKNNPTTDVSPAFDILVRFSYMCEHIVEHYLLPRIYGFEKVLRERVAAYALKTLCTGPLTQLLPIMIPSTSICASRHSAPSWIHRGWLYNTSFPIWHHYVAHHYLTLFSIPDSRGVAIRILEEFLERGADASDLCNQVLYVRRENEEPTILQVTMNDPPTLSSEGGIPVECWVRQQAAVDLPRSTPWFAPAKISHYLPSGQHHWLPVPKHMANKLSISNSEFDDESLRVRLRGDVAQFCVDVVNYNEFELENGLLDRRKMLEAGWGMHDGRYCHHPHQDECTQCGFEE